MLLTVWPATRLLLAPTSSLEYEEVAARVREVCSW